MIYEILAKMREQNSTLEKTKIAKKAIKEDKIPLFEVVVSMALDKVKYSYGITRKNLTFNVNNSLEHNLTLVEALNALMPFVDRTYTGNKAISKMNELLNSLDFRTQSIILHIIDRDLKVNYGRSMFNKLLSANYKITKPVYNRCSVYTEDHIKGTNSKGLPKKVKGTSNNIKYPALIQVKEDGTYRMTEVLGNKTTILSRSGEEYSYPNLESSIQEYFNNENLSGYLVGEMTVLVDKFILEKYRKKFSEEDLEKFTKK